MFVTERYRLAITVLVCQRCRVFDLSAGKISTRVAKLAEALAGSAIVAVPS